MSLAYLENDLSRSEGARETPLQWWEWAHENDQAYWLSGTPGAEVWGRLGVEEILKPGATVLNVGVGVGRCTRELAARGCKVSVLDISEAAIERVADVAKGYRANDLAALPVGAFDVALSHLVAQHMNDIDLEAQISHVVRALRPKGVFAVQYARDINGAEHDQSVTHHIKSGSIRRNQTQFSELIERAGGRVTQTFERETFPCGTVYMVAHIAPRREHSLLQRLGNVISRRR